MLLSSLTILISSWTLCSALGVNDSVRYTDIAIREQLQNLARATYLQANSFKELAQKSDLFIDTSLFIKEALGIMNQLNVFVVPPKFGRSMNLDMYKTFIEIPIDAEGNPTLQREHVELYAHYVDNYKLFKFGDVILDNGTIAKLHQPLQVSRYDDLFKKYQGKLPVISVDFGSVKGQSYKEIELDMWRVIKETYKKYSYLTKTLESDPKYSYELSQFKNIVEGQPSNVTLPNTLYFLSEQMVKKFPNKTIVILIDNDDAPVLSLKSHYEVSKREIGNLYSLMYKFLKATFINNPYLHHGLAVGSSRLGDGFSNYEVLRGRNIVDNTDPASYYFGLTNTTSHLLFDAFKIPLPSWPEGATGQPDSSKEWYLGQAKVHGPDVFIQPHVVLKYLMNEYEKINKKN